MINKRISSTFDTNINYALLFRLLVAMFLMSVCRLLFYSFNTSLFPMENSGHLFSLFVAGLKFDLVAVLYTNAVYIFAFLIPFRFRYSPKYQEVFKWVFYVTNGIAIISNCIDIVYYRFTLRRTSWTVFREFSNDKSNIQLGIQFLFDFWYIVVLVVLLIGLMLYLYNRVNIIASSIKSNWVYYPVFTLVLLLGVTLFVGGVRGGFAHSTRPITLSNAAEYTNTPAEIGIVLNTPLSIYKTLSKQPLKKVAYFNSLSQLESLYNPVHHPVAGQPFKPYNVVVIILESFSKEFFGVFNKNLDNGTYKGYTPFLDSLVQNSRTYTNSFATGRKSIDAMPSVLASIPSVVEPFVLSNYSGNSINSIASLLSAKGYDCSFFHGAPNGSMGFQAFAKMAGFQHYYGKTEFNDDSQFDGMWGIWDEPFFQFFARTLNEKKQPFMASIFSVSSHHPFHVPQEYEGKFPKGTQPIHQCVGYTDMSLRKFFASASKMPWYKNTLFVITADHTSPQVSHDVYNTSTGAYEVPIIFYKPGSDLKGVDDHLIFQTDIMPSVLSYLNYDKPYFAFGSDQLVAPSDKHFGVNYNSMLQLFKGTYVMQYDIKGAVGLYNYRQDPLLHVNLLGKELALRDSMTTLVNAFSQQYNNRMIENKLTVAGH